MLEDTLFFINEKFDKVQPKNLDRFLIAQEGNYPFILEELRSGQKEGHWMWYIFPQMRGLGKSELSEYFGLESMFEVQAYLEHEILGERYLECIEIIDKQMLPSSEINTIENLKKIKEMLGNDYKKLRSSVLVFSHCLDGNEKADFLKEIFEKWGLSLYDFKKELENL